MAWACVSRGLLSDVKSIDSILYLFGAVLSFMMGILGH